MAERICEAAERMPDVFGLSHNAGGDGDYDKNGIFVVSNIVEVRHVDLVADPATTKSLQESRQTKPLKESKAMDDNLKEAYDGLKEAMAKLEACYGDGKEMKEEENRRGCVIWFNMDLVLLLSKRDEKRAIQVMRTFEMPLVDQR